MKKAVLTAMIALTMTGAAANPVMAADRTSQTQTIDDDTVTDLAVEVYVQLVGLLLPAVQAAREAARKKN